MLTYNLESRSTRFRDERVPARLRRARAGQRGECVLGGRDRADQRSKKDAALDLRSDARIDSALNALYERRDKPRGGLGGWAPRVGRWLGDIREFFPTPEVQVIQKDAFARLGLKP
jgi:hypothetical protein